MYPARATLQHVMESGVTEGEKNTASFLFREWTQKQKKRNLKLKSNDF